MKGRPPGMHGYDIGGPRFGWIGEVKDGYPGANAWTILQKALEQCERIAAEKGLQARVRTFAVFHRRGQRYHEALVLFRDDEGSLVQMPAWEFRLYLEAQGVARED